MVKLLNTFSFFGLKNKNQVACPFKIISSNPEYLYIKHFIHGAPGIRH